MTTSLHETIHGFTTQYLIEQYMLHRDQYMHDAITIMEGEIKARGISDEDIKKALSDADADAAEAPVVVHYDKKMFTPLDGAFTTNDSMLARSMFSEHKIPFFQDTSASILPFTGDELDAHLVVFHIHNDSLDKAKSIVTEHFDLMEKRYTLKFSDVKERLKSFNFYEIPHGLLESKEIVEVDFSPAEKEVIVTYGTRLLSEADEIEARQNRVIFHFDSLEDLVTRLKGGETVRLTHTDLLASLEVLQIYCDDPGFPPAAEGIIEALLGFFLPHRG